MKMNIIKSSAKVLLGAALVVGFTGCEDLEVENLNEPDRNAILQNPEEYLAILEGQYASWWDGTEKSDPHWGLSITGHSMTSSWGNWAGQDLGTIPRIQLENTLTYNRRGVMTGPWYNLNGALAAANDVMKFLTVDNVKVIVGGVDKTQEAIAVGKGIQGLALGSLGLLFDQAFVVDETSDIESGITMVPYDQVISAARQKLAEAIQIASTNNFNVRMFNDIGWTSAQFAQYLRTQSAKLEALSARNAGETTSNTNWAEVLQLTNAGIDFDVNVLGDGGTVWWNRIKLQGQDQGWAQVSSRVINMMDSRMPYPWPDGVNTLPTPTDPRDARMTTDMTIARAPFQAARGYYFFSQYVYGRFLSYRANLNTNMLHMLVADNDLLRAEALVRTNGSKAQAAELINKTRVTRGGLTPMTGAESNDVLLTAILYEQLVELGWTNLHSNGYFYRRASTLPAMQLFPGTIPHLPVPAQELTVLGLPLYSFGGA